MRAKSAPHCGHRRAARWPQWSSLLRQLAETYASLRYGPDEGKRAELIAMLRAGITALPSVRAMRS